MVVDKRPGRATRARLRSGVAVERGPGLTLSTGLVEITVAFRLVLKSALQSAIQHHIELDQDSFGGCVEKLRDV